MNNMMKYTPRNYDRNYENLKNLSNSSYQQNLDKLSILTYFR